MEHRIEFRELLAADAALMLGVAEASDVAAALERYWARREQPGATFEAELAHVARLPPEALLRIRAEVDRLVGEAGGDTQLALTSHGGLDRSIHLALSKEGGGDLTRALSALGVPIRAPLRELPRDRYVGFEAAGIGGMGVVYAAIDTEMNRRVAFKMVRPHAKRGKTEQTPSHPLEASRPGKDTPESVFFEQLKARLVQEAWVTGALEHPGIVPVYEIGQTPTGIPYYTMRYVRGERTLADEIDEKRDAPIEERLALLDPFLKVCDTLRYAHDKGVVHRDLKPANVALGQYGEVVLLDWGLARLEGKEDVASSAWQERVEEMRHDAGFHTMEGGAIGTAGYMSPEATLGRLAEVDQRSDVYSLGAMLFKILTGRLPYEFRSYAEYAALLVREDPPEAREVASSVPEALSSLCAKALAREKGERPASAEEMAKAVRAWQVEDAAEREREGLLRDARAALESAERLTGEARLQQVDRAAAALAQAESKRPGGRRATTLTERAQALRETAIRERERASTRRTLRRVAVGALAAAAVAAFVVTTVIEGKREEAEKARAAAVDAQHATEAALSEKAQALAEVGKERDRANQERDAKATALETAQRERNEKATALDDVLRLADSKKVADLVAEARRLWPIVPEKAPDMEAWIARAKDVLARRGDHQGRLAAIREQALPYTEEAKAQDHEAGRTAIEAGKQRLVEIEAAKAAVEAAVEGDDAEAKQKELDEQAEAVRKEVTELEAGLDARLSWTFADPPVDWQHQVLVDLLAGLDRLDGDGREGHGGYLADVEKRHEFVTTLHARSIEDHATEWQETIAAIRASPKYDGLVIAPQLGLVPLGEDPDSHLFEFAHLGSGSLPKRDPETKRLMYEDDTVIVLVLIPGGTFQMGAQREDENATNYDPQAQSDESPLHEVTLSPFFLAKHECTQMQWKALTGGMDPSYYYSQTKQVVGGRLLTDRNPVEQVSWQECDGWLGRNRLVLPTEAQWEYACRAGTSTPWITGRDAAALGKVANIADRYCKEHGGAATWQYTEEVDDGHTVHAPVGSFAANDFGLHDMHGNVGEWCRGIYGAYAEEAATDPMKEGFGPVVSRGGEWNTVAGYARSAQRRILDPGSRGNNLGVRPARPITSD